TRGGRLSARQAGRVCNDSQHVIAEYLMCRRCQECGIHTAGVGRQRATEGAKALIQYSSLRSKKSGVHCHMLIRFEDTRPHNQIVCSFHRPRRNSRIPAPAIAASAITIEKNTPFDAKPARSLWKSNRPTTTLPDKLA